MPILMDEQLKTLFDYTKFHIGLYSALVGALLFASQTESLIPEDGWQRCVIFIAIKLAVICFLLAGLGGGIIASTISDHTDYKTFSTTPMGIDGLRKTFQPLSWWQHFEHRFFWAGIIIAVLGFLAAVW